MPFVLMVKFGSETWEAKKMARLAPRIAVNPAVRFGKPIIEGTRVPVDLVLARLGAGMSFEEVMAEYEISKDDILAVIAYAAKVVAGEEIRVTG